MIGNSVAQALLFKIYRLLFNLKRRQYDARIARSDRREAPDETGRLVVSAQKITVFNDSSRDIFFPCYPLALAHSFWRAQELTIFSRLAPRLSGDILDFGCGDGSFASCFLSNARYGVDIDPDAIAVARQYGIYRAFSAFDDMDQNVPSGSVRYVISCSVLEHTADLAACVQQIARVLAPGGEAHITVPGWDFHQQLSRLGGENFAATMNKIMFHRNLLSRDQWIGMLRQNGFSSVTVQGFQPIAFTQRYFVLSLIGTLGKIMPALDGPLLRLLLPSLLKDVAQSVDGDHPGGANLYIVATRA